MFCQLFDIPETLLKWGVADCANCFYHRSRLPIVQFFGEGKFCWKLKKDRTAFILQGIRCWNGPLVKDLTKISFKVPHRLKCTT